jgi:exopolyphosphatase / guanosine-5'-triphosphate,3'-diphosphate pyrophosphatase
MKAIIDLGTNTFHLLIAEVLNGKITEHKKLQIPVKLGEGGINQQTIAPAAFERGMDALKQFRETLNQFGIGAATAHGTSAIRDADNGLDFIDRAELLYQIHIKMLSGNEEAEIIYKGVSHSFDLPNQNVLVMDIGGGSVEFIIGKKDTILWKKSYPIGAARLVERFHKSDPIRDEDIISLQSYLVHNIIDLRDALIKYPTKILIGSAGSFETLTEVLRKDLQKGVSPISDYADEIDLPTFYEYATLIPSLSKTERAKLHGMIDFRVEMIVVATIMMDVIMKRFEMEKLIASHYSLKEGILFS